jgi:hypothetical protein
VHLKCRRGAAAARARSKQLVDGVGLDPANAAASDALNEDGERVTWSPLWRAQDLSDDARDIG